MAVGSPCFEQFPLAAHGLEWIHPEAPLAHPLDDGTAVLLERSLDATARQSGPRMAKPGAACWSRWPQAGRSSATMSCSRQRIPRHPC